MNEGGVAAVGSDEPVVGSSEVKLEGKVRELERFHGITLGREKRVIELKDRVKQLEAELARLNKEGNT